MADVDPNAVVSKVAVDLIKDAFKAAARSVKKLAKWVEDEAVRRDVLGEAARIYARNMQERYGHTRVLGMTEPVPLHDMYVRVNVLEKIQERLHRSLEDLEEQFQRDIRAFGRTIETKDGADVVVEKQRLLVLGKPGAGKTTFLRHLIFRAFDGKLPGKPIPIYIDLKVWSESGLSLLDYIVQEFDTCGLPDAQSFIEYLLEQGRCLVLLDGLDEITKEADEAIQQLRRFTDKYDQNRFVLSCRIAAYNHEFDRFTDVEVADFDDAQIEAFITNFFRKDLKTAEACWENLQEHPPTKELASVPLLLGLLCLAFDEAYDFPTNRADLYREAIDALLVKWDAKRRIRRAEVYKSLNRPHKEALLSQLAYRTFIKGQYFIPQRVLETYIGDYIQHLPEVNDATLMPHSEAVLQAIEAQHGLLVKRARAVYSFSHLTVQEYFTAKYIVDHQYEGTLDTLIEEHWQDESWREVILLTVGMLPDASEMMINMRRRLHLYATEENLTSWLREAAKSTKKGLPSPRSSSMSLMLLFILGRINQSSHFPTSRLLDYTRSLRRILVFTSELEYDLVLDDDKVHKSIQAYINEPELGLKMMPYLYGSTLMAICLISDFYIQKPTRQALLESILIEPWEPSDA